MQASRVITLCAGRGHCHSGRFDFTVARSVSALYSQLRWLAVAVIVIGVPNNSVVADCNLTYLDLSRGACGWLRFIEPCALSSGCCRLSIVSSRMCIARGMQDSKRCAVLIRQTRTTFHAATWQHSSTTAHKIVACENWQLKHSLTRMSWSDPLTQHRDFLYSTCSNAPAQEGRPTNQCRLPAKMSTHISLTAEPIDYCYSLHQTINSRPFKSLYQQEASQSSGIQLQTEWWRYQAEPCSHILQATSCINAVLSC